MEKTGLPENERALNINPYLLFATKLFRERQNAESRIIGAPLNACNMHGVVSISQHTIIFHSRGENWNIQSVRARAEESIT